MWCSKQPLGASLDLRVDGRLNGRRPFLGDEASQPDEARQRYARRSAARSEGARRFRLVSGNEPIARHARQHVVAAYSERILVSIRPESIGRIGNRGQSRRLIRPEL